MPHVEESSRRRRQEIDSLRCSEEHTLVSAHRVGAERGKYLLERIIFAHTVDRAFCSGLLITKLQGF